MSDPQLNRPSNLTTGVWVERDVVAIATSSTDATLIGNGAIQSDSAVQLRANGSTSSSSSAIGIDASGGVWTSSTTVAVNKGAASAAGAGLSILENGVETGYVKVGTDRSSFALRAPGRDTDWVIDQGTPLAVQTGTGLDVSNNLTTLATASSSQSGSLSAADYARFDAIADEFAIQNNTLSTSSSLDISGNLDVSGTISTGGVASHLIPSTSNLTLGTPDQPWQHLYISANSLNIGATTLSLDAQNNLAINGNSIVTKDASGATVDLSPQIVIDVSNNRLAIGKTSASASLDVSGDAVLSGSVAVGALESTTGTLNVGTTDSAINLGCGTTVQTVNIGTNSGATTINIGGSGDTVNIAGSLNYIQTTNLEVTDAQVVLNKGGASGSAGNAGLYVEENGTNTGYIKISASRDAWVVKDPSGTEALVPTTAGFSGAKALVSSGTRGLTESSVTSAELGYVSGVTSAIQTQLNAKQATVTGAASTITATDLSGSRTLVSDATGKVAVSAVTSTELGYLDGVTSAIQTQLNGKQATVTGAASTITGSNLAVSRTLTSDASGKVTASTVTSSELGYVSGVTSAIQTQLNAKQATVTGAASTITGSNLAVSRTVISDASGKVAVSAVTSTELGYLDGVTSAIQTQLNGKQATITGGASTITGINLTASRALTSDVSGKVAVSAVTSSELGYLDGVTSAIQTQLDGKMSASNNTFGSGASGSTIIGSNAIEIGQDRTNEGFAFIDLHGDTTYPDYSTRLIRGDTGANAVSELVHRGSGHLSLRGQDGGDIVLQTSGSVGIGNSAPLDAKLDVTGVIKNTGAAGGTLLINEYNTDNISYWKLATLTTTGNGHGMALDGNFSRVDQMMHVKYALQCATNTYRPYSEMSTVWGNNNARVLTYYDSSSNKVDVYLYVPSFTYVQFRMMYNNKSAIIYPTPTWTTSAPVTSDTYTLVHNTFTDSVITTMQDGSVGIGTTNPSNKVHAYENSSSGTLLLLEQASASGRAGIQLKNSGTAYNIQQVAGNTVFEQTVVGDVGFYNLGTLSVYDKNNTNATRLRVSSGGDVTLAGDLISNKAGPTFQAGSYNFGTATNIRYATNAFNSSGTSYTAAGVISLKAQTLMWGTDNSILVPGAELFLEGGKSPNAAQVAGSVVFKTNSAERVRINESGKVGIGNTAPDNMLSINPTIAHRNLYDHSTAQFTIYDPNDNGGSTPNGTRDIMYLVREGVGAQAFGNKAAFAIGRYEHSGTNSRTQLDIKLNDGSYTTDMTVLTLRSNGNVGIGVTAPTAKLDVGGSIVASGGLTASTVTASTVTASTVTASTVTASTLAGALQTAAQPNITSVGTLTGLTVGGAVNVPMTGAVIRMGTSQQRTISINDGFGNFAISSNQFGSSKVVETDGISRLLFGGDAAAGSVSLNAGKIADTGYSIGLNVVSFDNTIKVGATNNMTGMMSNNGITVADVSGNLYDAGTRLTTKFAALAGAAFTGNVGIGTATPQAAIHAYGAGQTAVNASTSSSLGGAMVLQDSGSTIGNGGMLVFGANQGQFAAIKGYIQSGVSNTLGDLNFLTRNAAADTTLTARMIIRSNGNVGIGSASPEYMLDVASNVRVFTNPASASHLNAGLQIRDGGSTVSEANAPRLSFNWDGKAAAQISMTSTGDLKIVNQTGIDLRSLSARDGTFSGTVSATALSGPLTGNASSATKLATARTINGVAFDGTADITITAPSYPSLIYLRTLSLTYPATYGASAWRRLSFNSPSFNRSIRSPATMSANGNLLVSTAGLYIFACQIQTDGTKSNGWADVAVGVHETDTTGNFNELFTRINHPGGGMNGVYFQMTVPVSTVPRYLSLNFIEVNDGATGTSTQLRGADQSLEGNGTMFSLSYAGAI